MRVIVKRCELLSDNRHFFDLTLSQKDANYEKMSMVSRGLHDELYISLRLQDKPVLGLVHGFTSRLVKNWLSYEL